MKNELFIKKYKKYRNITKKDRLNRHLLTGCLGTALNLIDSLEGTDLVKGTLKNKINIAYKAILEYELNTYNKQVVESEKLDPNSVWQQQELSYKYVESWMQSFYKIDEEFYEEADKEITQIIEKYSNKEIVNIDS